MPSRDPADLHPLLRERWLYLYALFTQRYPDEPEPRLSCTYRSNAEQLAAYLKGKSNAHPGESLHNFRPAYAFDVFFNDDRDTPEDKSDDVADWDFANFKRFGVLAEGIGLEWGGRWPDLVDGPHIQLPMTYEDARVGRLPTLPPLPGQPHEDEQPWTVSLYAPGGKTQSWVVPHGTDVVQRIDPSNRKIHIDIGREDN